MLEFFITLIDGATKESFIFPCNIVADIIIFLDSTKLEIV